MANKKGCCGKGLFLYIVIVGTLSFLSRQCVEQVSEAAIQHEEKKERMRQRLEEERKKNQSDKVSSSCLMDKSQFQYRWVQNTRDC